MFSKWIPRSKYRQKYLLFQKPCPELNWPIISGRRDINVDKGLALEGPKIGGGLNPREYVCLYISFSLEEKQGEKSPQNHPSETWGNWKLKANWALRCRGGDRCRMKKKFQRECTIKAWGNAEIKKKTDRSRWKKGKHLSINSHSQALCFCTASNKWPPEGPQLGLRCWSLLTQQHIY